MIATERCALITELFERVLPAVCGDSGQISATPISTGRIDGDGSLPMAQGPDALGADEGDGEHARLRSSDAGNADIDGRSRDC